MLFTKLRASFLYGRALNRFYRRKYEDAARLLEKSLKLDPFDERNELTLVYLGRSYLALGRLKEAMELLSRAYQPYFQRKATLESDFEQKEFLEFLNAYHEVLHKMGELDRAREVAHEAEEYVKTIRKAMG